MAHVRKKTKRHFAQKNKTDVDEIVSLCKKKKAATPEKMARLLGHLSSRMALR